MAVDSEARGRRLEADIAAHVAVVLTGLAVWCDSPRHSSRRHARPSRAEPANNMQSTPTARCLLMPSWTRSVNT